MNIIKIAFLQTLIGDTKSTPLPDSSDSYTTSNTALVNNSEVSVSSYSLLLITEIIFKLFEIDY